MLFTTHLCAGAVLGRFLPAPLAFGVGVLSHLAMDAVPHWGNEDPDAFFRAARMDGLAGLVAAATLVAAAPRGRRPAVAAGIAGAGLLDMDKPFRHFFGFSPFPRRVDDFHARIQEGREAPSRWPVDAVSTVAALLVLGVAGRARARQPVG